MVLLLQDLECGGTQRYALNLLRHIDRQKFEPQLWVLRRGDFFLHEVQTLDVEHRQLSQAERVNPLSFVRLVKLLRQEQPHILYNLTVIPNVWGRLVGWLCRVPIIVGGYRNTYPAQFEWIFWRLANMVICNAKALQDILVKHHRVPPELIRTIPNGVDTNEFAPNVEKKEKVPTVLCAARYVSHKGQRELIEIFSRVVEVLPKARLELVGDGPCKDDLKQFVQRTELRHNVSVRNATSNILEELQRAWLFVLLSSDEGTSNVLLEAQAAGLPVIGNNISSIAEIVSHGETGYLFDRKEKGKICQQIITILTDEKLRTSMASKARQRVEERFSLTKMVHQTEDVLTELCEVTL